MSSLVPQLIIKFLILKPLFVLTLLRPSSYGGGTPSTLLVRTSSRKAIEREDNIKYLNPLIIPSIISLFRNIVNI